MDNSFQNYDKAQLLKQIHESRSKDRTICLRINTLNDVNGFLSTQQIRMNVGQDDGHHGTDEQAGLGALEAGKVLSSQFADLPFDRCRQKRFVVVF